MCPGHAHISVGSENIKDVRDVNVTPFNKVVPELFVTLFQSGEKSSPTTRD